MKQKFQKMIKIAAFAAFAIAMLVNLKTNILGESGVNKAFASETVSNKKFAWSWPACTGTRMCGNKSVSYSGIKLKCVSGSDFENCTDGTTCTPNAACTLD
jgi:hypothetical protein